MLILKTEMWPLSLTQAPAGSQDNGFGNFETAPKGKDNLRQSSLSPLQTPPCKRKVDMQAQIQEPERSYFKTTSSSPGPLGMGCALPQLPHAPGKAPRPTDLADLGQGPASASGSSRLQGPPSFHFPASPRSWTTGGGEETKAHLTSESFPGILLPPRSCRQGLQGRGTLPLGVCLQHHPPAGGLLRQQGSLA